MNSSTNQNTRLSADAMTLIQNMMDADPFCSMLLDETFKLIHCNNAMVDLFGLSSKEELYENVGLISPPYQPGGEPSEILALQMVQATLKNGSMCREWMHCTLSGEPMPVEVRSFRVEFEGIPFVMTYLKDLRDLKVSEAQTREVEERTRIMLDSAPIMAVIWSDKRVAYDCSEETFRLFDLSSKQEFFERFDQLAPKYQSDGRLSSEVVAESFGKVTKKGYNKFEFAHQKPNGELIPCMIIQRRIDRKDGYDILGYAFDLREQKSMLREIKKTEDELRLARDLAEESNKAKSKFLATVSHEIRTPMNAILGIAETQMQNDTLDSESKDLFGKIHSSGELLLHIINDILDLSKIEAGKLEPVLKNYRTASLINDCVHGNFLRFMEKSLHFSLEVDANLPETLLGDEFRIKQILNNILSNAFKYTNQGEIRLKVYPSDSTEKEYTFLNFDLADTGQGMTPDQVGKLFREDFTRFNLEANRTTIGTGLGLNITYHLVRLMEGEITVESQPGVGSHFAVRLPQKKVDDKVLGEALAKNLQSLRFLHKIRDRKAILRKVPMPYGRILLVDDMEANIDVAKLLLKPYQLHIDTATSGFEAIKLVENGKSYDIIFMDHMMPRMDGIEATRQLRQLGYTQPIVALTANAVSGADDLFLKNGFDGFISKPIDTRELDALLNKMIRDRHQKK